jgi:hypothetical protein
MRKESWRFFGPPALTIAAMLTLVGCGSSDYLGKPKEVDPNIVPVDYRKEIVDTLKGLLVDPTNVKDAFISEPALMPVGKEQRYASCVRLNARGYHREYLGSKDRVAYFFGGHLNQLVDATKEQCGNAAYKPFPEVEKLCLGKSCE